jgi:hypothetical protein
MGGRTNLSASELETGLSSERRAGLRSEALKGIPSWYSPIAHLAFPSLVGIATLIAAIALIRDLRAWQVAIVPIALVVLNAGEWRIHRDLLHKRVWPLQVLYDRHTPIHHMIFVTDDMAIRDRREFRLVLIPFYGILAAALGTLPIPLLLAVAGQWNVALLFMATAMAYVVSYEWLHLSYHLPPNSFIGRMRLIAILRRHHATHHNPRLMQKWNFNVTIPFWDLVRGTIYR